jgi:ATPase subunit of ABC transporter with duplicated ATPase domains
MVQPAVGTLSRRRKARLVLAMLVWQRPNLLLLDEPTNHLDLTTREALSIALNEFEGTVMLVSHDRALLREVCDEFWLVARRRRATLRRRPGRLPEVAAGREPRQRPRPAGSCRLRLRRPLRRPERWLELQSEIEAITGEAG